MTSSRLLKTIHILLYILVIGTPLFYLRQAVYPYITAKTLFFQAVVELIFFLYLALLITDPRYRPRRSPLIFALLVFILVLLGTSFFGIDPWRSFWSTQERMMGVFGFLHLGALFLVLSSLYKEINWKKLFLASLVTASLVSVISFIQLKNPNFLLHEPSGGRPGSTFGNPTFLAGYLLFHIFLALYLLLEHKKNVKQERPQRALQIFLVASLALTLGAVMLTQTRGDILALAAGVFAFLILLMITPLQDPSHAILGRRSFYAIIIALIVSGGIFFWATRSNPFWENIPGLRRFREISIGDQALGPRLHALKAAWLGFKEKPFLGWGWDNFNIVFNKHYNPKLLEISYQETRFDKPHNVFLENMVAGGIPLFLAHLVFLGFLLYEVWRVKESRLLAQAGTAALTAYLVRSAFIFDTLGPLLMLYVAAGFIDGRFREFWRTRREIPQEEKRSARRLSPGLAALPVLCALLIAYFINIRTTQAVYHQFWGFTNFVVRSSPPRAISSFKKAIAIWSPYRWNFERDYAAAIAEAYFYNPDRVPKEEVVHAIEAMEAVVKEHPHDAYNHYALLDMYNQTSDIDQEKFLAKAEKEAAEALRLSPERQQVYFSLAKTKHLEGEREEALALVERGLALNPNVADAHFYYGLLLSDLGEREEGYQELKKAIELGRGWKNYYELLTVGNFFADAGYLDDAIELYKKGLDFRPAGEDRLELQMKIGLAYFFKGDKAEARRYIEEVVSEFDLRTSPSYNQFKLILDDLGITP